MLLGVDVGGTFTDAALLDGERLHTAKVPSTPEDQSSGVIAVDTILVVNAGSSSVKFQVFGADGTSGPRRLIKGQMDGIGTRPRLCAESADKTALIDYKDARVLGHFLSERGKILPSRITGNCSGHQRHLTTAIKRARTMALLPFTTAYP